MCLWLRTVQALNASFYFLCKHWWFNTSRGFKEVSSTDGAWVRGQSKNAEQRSPLQQGLLHAFSASTAGTPGTKHHSTGKRGSRIQHHVREMKLYLSEAFGSSWVCRGLSYTGRASSPGDGWTWQAGEKAMRPHSQRSAGHLCVLEPWRQGPLFREKKSFFPKNIKPSFMT